MTGMTTQMAELRLSGSGGQGLLLAGRILSEALVAQGRLVSQSQSYEPTSRGGLSRADLIVADEPADYPLVTALDWLIILDQCAATASDEVLKPGALILADAGKVTAPPNGPYDLRRLPLIKTARQIGNERVANLVAVGALIAATHLLPATAMAAMIRRLTPPEFQVNNLAAFDAGLALAGGA